MGPVRLVIAREMPYLLAVRRLVVLVVATELMEVVLVQLTNEAGKVAVLEVLRENLVGELVRLP